MLREPGIKDEPGEDGLTGFAIALGYKNVEMTLCFLQSDVQPRKNMLFLAEEILKEQVHYLLLLEKVIRFQKNGGFLPSLTQTSETEAA